MALTFKSLRKNKTSNGWLITGKVDLDDDYPSGGYTFKPTDVGLTTLLSAEFSTVSDDYVVSENGSTISEGKIKVYDVSGSALTINSTSGGAPLVTIGGAAMTAVLSGFSGTTAGNVTTVTAGGAAVAENALAGATISDGTVETTVVSNTTLTATSGTITTVTALSASITATGVAYVATGTSAAHTHTTSGGSGGGLSEVSAATDLSNCTDIEFMMTGY